MADVRFGNVQYRIMKVLWKKGRANAREITDGMQVFRPIAHSTVQTLLRKLEEKGVVNHENEERTFVFFPLVTEEEVTGMAVRDIVTRVFGGSAKDLVSWVIASGMLSKADAAALQKELASK